MRGVGLHLCAIHVYHNNRTPFVGVRIKLWAISGQASGYQSKVQRLFRMETGPSGPKREVPLDETAAFNIDVHTLPSNTGSR